MNKLAGLLCRIGFWGFLLLLGLGLSMAGAWDLWEVSELSSRGVPMQATIVRLDFREEYDDGRRQVRYDLVYRVDGAERDSKQVSISETLGNNWRLGQKIDVISLPESPHIARPVAVGLNWWFGAIVTPVGLLLLAGIIWVAYQT